MRSPFAFTVLFIAFLFGSLHEINAQFNPYQSRYQGWNGDQIYRSPIRKFLNFFSLNVSMGYGRTFYNVKPGVDVLETPERIILLNNYSINGNSVSYSGVSNWMNSPDSVAGTVAIGNNIGDNRVLFNDSSATGYRGSGYNIPLTLGLHVDIIKRFRVGVGAVFEWHGFKKLRPKENGYFPYQPDFNSVLLKRYFFTVGGKVYNLKGWTYYLDIQLGKVNYGKKAYDRDYVENGLYFNIGVPIEFEYSEYFFVFFRPSFDIKNYKVNMPGGGTQNLPAQIKVGQPQLTLNFGVRIKYPEIPRCPVKSCQTQLKHVHGSKEFRGQPFYKKQNPKIGELYPELQRNKGKNRRRMGGGN